MKLAPYVLALALAFALCVPVSAAAESRVFIIANQPDGYGIDQCLAGGEPCGASAASAYCQSREFRTATAYRRVDPDEVAETTPASSREACFGQACAVAYVAITCER